MIKKIYGKGQFFNEVAETLAMTNVVAGGGVPSFNSRLCFYTPGAVRYCYEQTIYDGSYLSMRIIDFTFR